MDDIYEKILREGYCLKFYGGSRTRTGLVCKTDNGLRELKKVRGRNSAIAFAHDVKERLYKNGFSNISRFYLTEEGQPYYITEGTAYVLEDVLPEASLPEDSIESFVLGSETLGRLHAAAKGLKSEHSGGEGQKLPEQMEKRCIELAKIKKRIQRQKGYDAIDIIFLGCADECMEQTRLSSQLLKEAEHPYLLQKNEEEGGFCHHAYKGDNLRLGDKGSLYVGGFERCTGDLPLTDLAGYLKRYMKKMNGDKNGVEGMLSAYEAACPMDDRERLFVKAIAIYPEKLLRLINEYYNKRRTCVSPAMRERFINAVEEEKKTRTLFDYL